MRAALLALVACAKPAPPVALPDYAAEDYDGDLVAKIRANAKAKDVERAVGLHPIFEGVTDRLVADPEHVDEAPPRDGEVIYWRRPIRDDEPHVVGLDAKKRVFFAIVLAL